LPRFPILASSAVLTVTTGADSAVTGGHTGIYALQQGTGALSVTANGEVTGTDYDGIFASISNSSATGDLTVTTGADSAVTGGVYGIYARQSGTGALSVTANGEVIGTDYDGIFAYVSNAGSSSTLTVTTGADSAVSGGDRGIAALQRGTGALEITANGGVIGTDLDGIFALISNTGSSADLTVTTSADSLTVTAPSARTAL
jgi:hypothetical protein